MRNSRSDEKILRIGIIQGGKVIEERLLRRRATATFGSDAGNTFAFPTGALAATWPLFEVASGRYRLVFDAEMNGRVSIDGTNVDLASLRENLAERAGDKYRLELAENSRGRVQIGDDVTVLFHFISPPPVAAKPELPKSVTGGWAKSLEPLFTTVLTMSFFVHAVTTVLVFSVDPPPPPPIEDMLKALNRFASPRIARAPVVEESISKTRDEAAPKVAAKPKPAPKKDVAPAATASPMTQAQRDARRARVRDQFAGKGMLAGIGVRGEGTGSLADVFKSGVAIGDDLQDALRGTRGVEVAVEGAITRRDDKHPTEAVGVERALVTAGGHDVAIKPKVKAGVTGKVKTTKLITLDGKIDKKRVTAAIRRHREAFQQCYEHALKTNSKLGGKLEVEFTINARGRVSDTDVIKDGLGSSVVSRCVEKTLKMIRFPTAKDGEVTISNVFVFTPSQ